MRNLTILLSVAAFALAAGNTVADCPDADTIFAEHCSDLPMIGRVIQSQGCIAVFWNFEFFRTSDTRHRCVVTADIKNTSVSVSIDSKDLVPNTSHSISGTGVINGSPIQCKMKHDPYYDDPGPFSKLKFSYKIY